MFSFKQSFLGIFACSALGLLGCLQDEAGTSTDQKQVPQDFDATCYFRIYADARMECKSTDNKACLEDHYKKSVQAFGSQLIPYSCTHADSAGLSEEDLKALSSARNSSGVHLSSQKLSSSTQISSSIGTSSAALSSQIQIVSSSSTDASNQDPFGLGTGQMACVYYEELNPNLESNCLELFNTNTAIQQEFQSACAADGGRIVASCKRQGHRCVDMPEINAEWTKADGFIYRHPIDPQDPGLLTIWPDSVAKGDWCGYFEAKQTYRYSELLPALSAPHPQGLKSTTGLSKPKLWQ
jgi:hypothetical protein